MLIKEKGLSIEERIYFFQKKYNRLYGRTFILPTKFGVYFIIIIFILFLISLSYGHSLAISATFLFVSMVIFSAIYTNYNLAGISYNRLRAQGSFFMKHKYFIEVTNNLKAPRLDIEIEVRLSHKKNKCKYGLRGQTSLIGREKSRVLLEMDSSSHSLRGCYEVDKIKLTSSFPFGLFYSWIYLSFPNEGNTFFIFPRAVEPIYDFKLEGKKLERKNIEVSNEVELKDSNKIICPDEFYEHSPYLGRGGINRIDWRIYSRSDELFEKKYQGSEEGELILNREVFKSYDIEQQMSFLCFLVMKFCNEGRKFALVLNDENAVWGQGKLFERKCLERLSEF